MKVLVAGGSYFVGRTIVEHLRDEGHDVTLLNRGSRPVAGTQQLVADRSDSKAVTRALAGRRFDWVVDTTSESTSHVDSIVDALGDRFGAWLYVSSASVYAEDGRFPMSEDHPTGPSLQWGAYGDGKRVAEARLLERLERLGVPCISLRPPYVYGPGNTVAREGWLWARILAGRPVLIPDDGTTPIQFVHAEDLAGAVSRCFTTLTDPGGHRFNVGDPEWTTLDGYVRSLAEACGTPVETRRVPYTELGVAPRAFFPFRDYPCVLDASGLIEATGWGPNWSLRDGLSQTFAQLDRDSLLTTLDTTEEDRILSALR